MGGSLEMFGTIGLQQEASAEIPIEPVGGRERFILTPSIFPRRLDLSGSSARVQGDGRGGGKINAGKCAH